MRCKDLAVAELWREWEKDSVHRWKRSVTSLTWLWDGIGSTW